MAAEITLILGGARSGKSHHAEVLAADYGPRVLYIATAEAHDEEMSARIKAHRLSRPKQWETLEAPLDVGAKLAMVNNRYEALLLDCMTLLVSNLMHHMEDQPPDAVGAAVQVEVEAVLAAQSGLDIPLIIVSNEVGLGLVPPYPLGRTYRDVLGRVNQRLAARADRVLFMVAGLPMVIKGGGKSFING